METRVTDYIVGYLGVWKIDFAFLFYMAYEKAYIEIASAMGEFLWKKVGKRFKADLDKLSLAPYKPNTKDEVTVQNPLIRQEVSSSPHFSNGRLDKGMISQTCYRYFI